MQLDRGRAQLARALDGVPVWRDEQTRANPRVVESDDPFAQALGVVTNIETAFGRDLLPPFGDQRHLMRPQTRRDREHFVRASHLEVEYRRDRRCETLDVDVLNVPPVFAEMRGDPVGARPFAEFRRGHGIRLIASPGLSNGRDVVDVDVEPLPL